MSALKRVAIVIANLKDDAPARRKPFAARTQAVSLAPASVKLLGTKSDTQLAREFALLYKVVRAARLDRNIPRFRATRCGTITAYRRGCRCADCRTAHATTWKAWNHQRKPRMGRRKPYGPRREAA